MKRIIYIVLLTLINVAITSELIAQQPSTTTSTTAKKNVVVDTKPTARILKQANKQMGLLKYAYAIPLYKNYLKAGGKQDTLALKNIGSAYKLVNQYDSALLYYTKAKDAGVKINNTIAELAAQMGNYKKAINDYEQLNEEDKNLLNDSRIFGFSNIGKFYADSLDYTIYYTKLNSPYNDFNAVPFRDGIVFESNRVITKKRRKQTRIVSPEFGWDGAAYSSLYYVENTKGIRIDTALRPVWKEKKIDDKVLSKGTSNDTRLLDKPLDYQAVAYQQDTSIKLFSKRLGTKLNIGSITFTKDGQTAYYTRNGKKTSQGYLLEVWEAKLIEGKWVPAGRLFFNKTKYNYFHPAVTPDGRRLYYVSDEPNGFGGTDIYFTEKNEDGSWKPTTNAGQNVNTAGNELFPTFYDGGFYYSSNGLPGLGGLDIFKLVRDARGDINPRNLGYPINSDRDELGFTIKGSTGYFSSNRYGSDDIFAFDYAPVNIIMEGKVAVDSVMAPGKKVYLNLRNEAGKLQVIDSAVVNANGSYSFKARPNKEYTVVTFNSDGEKFETLVKSNDFVKQDNGYQKKVALINIPLTRTEILAKRAKEEAAQENARQAQASLNRLYAKTVDSLMKLSKDYVELHHPFNQVYIIQKDLTSYKQLIERIKQMEGREIVIVSATDCNGSDAYNEDLSQRRAKHIYKTLSKLSNNSVVIKHVGERELLKACEDVKKSILEQQVNRYSYVFIMDKK
jgi:outer membrane protein OmpA-like peptidoglycan-associated protein/tetratricopeptide (TPR) repeat protein